MTSPDETLKRLFFIEVRFRDPVDFFMVTGLFTFLLILLIFLGECSGEVTLDAAAEDALETLRLELPREAARVTIMCLLEGSRRAMDESTTMAAKLAAFLERTCSLRLRLIGVAVVLSAAVNSTTGSTVPV